MIEPGDVAPDFQLPGVRGGSFDMFDLHEVVEGGDAVLLVFLPTDFLALPTDVLVAMGERGWSNRGGFTVWAISGDSIFAHRSYAREYAIDVAMLSDFHATVADNYGLTIPDWEGHGPTPTWAWVLVAPDWQVVRIWAAAPTPDWSVPPVEAFVDDVRETARIDLEGFDVEAP